VLIAGFPSDVTATNCWVIAPADGEQCVVVDPGIGVEAQLDEVIAEHRLHPVAFTRTTAASSPIRGAGSGCRKERRCSVR
jgi:hydroxyacylglutathione hydrolase